MTIKMTECEGTDAGRGLLRDLAKYECLLDWVQALVDRSCIRLWQRSLFVRLGIL